VLVGTSLGVSDGALDGDSEGTPLCACDGISDGVNVGNMLG
jgi:hypothetical protein